MATMQWPCMPELTAMVMAAPQVRSLQMHLAAGAPPPSTLRLKRHGSLFKRRMMMQAVLMMLKPGDGC